MKNNKIVTRSGILLLTVGVLYLSAYAYSIVGGMTIKIAMIMLCIIGCMLIRPLIYLPNKVKFVGITIFSISFGAFFSFILYKDNNVWLDPVFLILTMIVAYMITKRIEFSRFVHYYCSCMALFTAVAIVIWLFGELGIEVPGYIYTSLNGQQFKTIWICTWHMDYNRLMGPFWEPGIYASFAIIGIIFEGIFSGKQMRKYVIVLLSIGILLSQSTAGYIIVLFAYYILLRSKKKLSLGIDLIVILLTIIGVFYGETIIYTLVDINEDVFAKLLGDQLTTNTRLMSPLACLNVFFKNPFTGLGMNYAVDVYNTYKPIYHMDALTSTNFFLLAAFGIGGITYTIGWILAFINKKTLSLITRLLLCIVFFLILNKEPHYSIMLTYIFLFYLLNQKSI